MHWLKQKSNKAMKLFGLKDFMASDNIPHLITWNYQIYLIICTILLSTKYGLVKT